MAIPLNIDHFRIIKEIGTGSHGVVYLAKDIRLERQVAIKMQTKRLSTRGDRDLKLMYEEQILSKLRHPNIIPIYETGEYEGSPFFVMEYVKGTSLRDLIKKDGHIVVPLAVTLTSRILEAIAYIHKQGVIHGCLSPSSIQIESNMTPRIMGFGMYGMIGQFTNTDRFHPGSPLYLSPEHFQQTRLLPQSDIFSLGLVCYEMLTGKPIFKADDQFTLQKIINQPVEPPSSKNKTVDQKLDSIILKAIEKKQELRYANAPDMKEALDVYLDINKKSKKAKKTVQEDKLSTVELLLRRMSRSKDFPTTSKYIVEINQKLTSKEKYFSASDLANVVLKDYALTNKLLKLVNSAFYGTVAGTVTTVTRAIVVLGFDQVRMAVVSLILFDHLRGKRHVEELKDCSASSFIGGLFARNFAERLSIEPEEAFICAMFRNLGKHLVLFHLQEEYEEIQRTMEQKGFDEQMASKSVLGISYDKLGVEISKAWKFPEKITSSMELLPNEKVGEAKSERDILRVISNYSNEVCRIVSNTQGDARIKELESISKNYNKIVPVSRKQLLKLLDSTRNEIEKHSKILNINNSNFVRRLAFEPEVHDQIAPVCDTKPVAKIEEQKIAEKIKPFPEKKEVSPPTTNEDELRSTLINGMLEISDILVGNYKLNDLTVMIIETMYRGFCFNRIMFCMVDPKSKRLQARFGFGKDVDTLIPKFGFEITKSSDIFNVAVSQAQDFFIDDSNAPNIKKHIPEWYRIMLNAPAFIIYPLFINKVCLGLFYADREYKGPPISANQQNYMKTLRNQFLIGVKQNR